MGKQEMTDLVSRKTNALDSRNLASIIVSGAVICPRAKAVSTVKLSPKLDEIDKKRAEKIARKEAARLAMKAAAERRAEEARLREEAARARRMAMPVREQIGD